MSKKAPITIQNYNSDSSLDDDIMKEVITRVPSERRSKPSMSDLRDQSRVFPMALLAPKSSPPHKQTTGPIDQNYEAAGSSQSDPVFPPSTVELPQVVNSPSSVSSLSSTSSSGTSSSLSSLSTSEENDGAKKKQPVAKTANPGSTKDKKIKKKKKVKKDPKAPPKPVSAYALFFRDTQASIKADRPEATFGEISKVIASLWDNLDAEKKTEYKRKTETAKKEYLRKLAAYKAKLISGEVSDEGDNQNMAPQPQESYNESNSNYPGGHRPHHYAGSHHSASHSVMGKASNRCITEGCNNISIDDPRWDRQFCSTECVVRHCREVFQNWVALQQPPETVSASSEAGPTSARDEVMAS